MTRHPDARPAPRGRETLASRIESGVPVAEAARQMGVSRQTASRWLHRGRSGERLADRGSRPLRIARLTPPEAEERVRDVHGPLPALLRGTGARHGRQRPGVQGPGPRRAVGIRGGPARVHEALQPVAERQGRAHEPRAGAGMAVCPGMGQRGREGGRPPGLHRAL